MCLFIFPSQQCYQISNLGNFMMMDLFCGNPSDLLESLRHNIFTKKVATTEIFVTPERHSPALLATLCYSKRIYYQIILWMRSANMKPAVLGWKQDNDLFIPVMTHNNAAPEELGTIIHGNCFVGFKFFRCSCRRNGLPCTAV
ncbi:hypothetical protein DPMN_084436 [Dreissena polymorpha]|uniref:Uncharacterized protein n=1 Tax=Dreissena polymorpha TaxID=45954 RepID=A0A9D4BJD8_DREPO|nr:hypothetical protein DPMN_084436 [Dreissena polymorpha]